MLLWQVKTYLFLLAALATGCTASMNTSAQQAQQDETRSPTTRGTITGRVVTDSGQPLPNASISVRASQPLFQPRTTTTDNEGNFQVSNLDPVLYGVAASAPAYVMPARDPDSQPNYYRIGDMVTVSLVKGGVITGLVQSSTGEPVVQIAVKAVMVRDANGQRPKYSAFQMQRTTDDRGIYRIYGLLPGTYVVSTGGRGVFNAFFDAYENDAPTYAPSSSRDTAAEIVVRAGEEIGSVDIRYRGEPGHTISGFVGGTLESNLVMPSNVTLLHISNGAPMGSSFSFQPPNSKGFAFYGVGDGEYDLVAQSSLGQGETAISEPRRITVKGADITGIELLVKPLGSIGGRVTLEKSDAAECKNKRQPLFSETLIVARRSEKDLPKDQPRLFSFFAAQGSPTKSGEFQLRNIAPGPYALAARFFAKYWYLRSITREAPPPASAMANTTGTPRRQADLARDGISLRYGERLKDITFTLTEGAASLRGAVKPSSGKAIPQKLYVHLIPAEKENLEDVMRFFADEVQADGTFALNNLPPGRYRIVARVASVNESQLQTRVRAPGEMPLRAQLRRVAEADKTEIEFKPCQNVIDFALPLKPN